jgi:hypothetical protein
MVLILTPNHHSDAKTLIEEILEHKLDVNTKFMCFILLSKSTYNGPYVCLIEDESNENECNLNQTEMSMAARQRQIF